METSALRYREHKPDASLAHFVDSFWMLVNPSDEEKAVVVLPDGRVDLFFSQSADEPFHCTLLGLASEPSRSTIAPKSVIFAVSFKLLAVEYLLNRPVSSLLNTAAILSTDFWDVTAADLDDFDAFCRKLTTKIRHLATRAIDERKRKLFDLIYSSPGTLPVGQLAAGAHWSSRQINRYFTHWFGLSLKTYCTILRYRASFGQIRAGKLFPEQHFVDQAHFIKDVKKYSGVTPKELTKNPDDRFIQFALLPKP